MVEYVLAIDDTGFATGDKNFDTLKTEECCFCSVAVRKDLLPIINEYMKQKTDDLFAKFNTREFHFTHMYNRRGDFENIELEQTLDYIRDFAEDVKAAGMIFTVSTINKHSYKDPAQVMLMNMIEQVICPNVHLSTDKKSVNLILNILRSDISLTNILGPDAKIVEVVCDEGLRKNGASFSLNLTKGNVDVKFSSSETNYLLQFADFAAWFVTRAKHILDKPAEKQKEWEKELLEIYSSLPYANMGEANYIIGDTDNFDYDQTVEDLQEKQKN